VTSGEEAVATAVGGALLGGLAGRAVGAAPLGAVIGGINGAVAGFRGICDWISVRGRAAFVLDSTWSMVSTGAGLVLMSASKARELLTGRAMGYEPSLSSRRNRFVHRGGVVLRRGFAVTIGNVINGAADRRGELTESRRHLVDEHEDVHVWQERVLGPLYPVLYTGWFIGGVLLAIGRRGRSNALSLSDDIDNLAYYRNPFEWHAYSRAGEWPPAWVDSERVWRRPFRWSEGSPTTRR